MRAIHVTSFAPLIARGAERQRAGCACPAEQIQYEFAELKNPLDKFELYNTVLSALTWRKYNGEIDLICDTAALEYFTRTGITEVYSAIRPTIPADLEGINPAMFWAAAKLLALRDTPAPVVILDTDFIVWKKLKFNNAVIAAHREDLYPDVYPPPDYFRMNPGYSFNPAFNYAALPLNTAFLYLPDETFKQYYTNMAIEFMKSAQDIDDCLCYMVYAEQRMLAMCADYLKVQVRTLLDKDRVFEPQKVCTHLWGEKQRMRDDPQSAERFNRRCASRIEKEFSEYVYLVETIERINQ
ncbi:MAG: hypothetical protein FWH20_10740 [Oscillospiraceae bacterium]|nr:hypothetical protein [Oscillospiraceae bacterium]